jgi:hypothetical protein
MSYLINIIELCGTFLLAVEAIKIKNLKKWLRNIHLFNFYLNPPLEFVDEENSLKNIDEQKTKSIQKDIICDNIFEDKSLNLNYVFGGLLLLSCIIYFPLFFGNIDIFSFLPVKDYKLLWIVKVILIVLLGTILWTIIIYFIKLMVYILSKIINNTESGIIGIIGFLFFVISFILKTFIKN